MTKERNKVPFGKVLLIYTAGASRGNPGHSALSFTLTDEEGYEYHKYSEYLGVKTNNQAEMLAVKQALDKAIEFTRGKIKVHSDSNNTVCWLNRSYRVKSENIRPIFDEIQKLRPNFESIEFIHLPRENAKISICDALCNSCLDTNTGKKKSQWIGRI